MWSFLPYRCASPRPFSASFSSSPSIILSLAKSKFSSQSNPNPNNQNYYHSHYIQRISHSSTHRTFSSFSSSSSSSSPPPPSSSPRDSFPNPFPIYDSLPALPRISHTSPYLHTNAPCTWGYRPFPISALDSPLTPSTKRQQEYTEGTFRLSNEEMMGMAAEEFLESHMNNNNNNNNNKMDKSANTPEEKSTMYYSFFSLYSLIWNSPNDMQNFKITFKSRMAISMALVSNPYSADLRIHGDLDILDGLHHVIPRGKRFKVRSAPRDCLFYQKIPNVDTPDSPAIVSFSDDTKRISLLSKKQQMELFLTRMNVAIIAGDIEEIQKAFFTVIEEKESPFHKNILKKAAEEERDLKTEKSSTSPSPTPPSITYPITWYLPFLHAAAVLGQWEYVSLLSSLQCLMDIIPLSTIHSISLEAIVSIVKGRNLTHRVEREMLNTLKTNLYQIEQIHIKKIIISKTGHKHNTKNQNQINTIPISNSNPPATSKLDRVSSSLFRNHLLLQLNKSFKRIGFLMQNQNIHSDTPSHRDVSLTFTPPPPTPTSFLSSTHLGISGRLVILPKLFFFSHHQMYSPVGIMDSALQGAFLSYPQSSARLSDTDDNGDALFWLFREEYQIAEGEKMGGEGKPIGNLQNAEEEEREMAEKIDLPITISYIWSIVGKEQLEEKAAASRPVEYRIDLQGNMSCIEDLRFGLQSKYWSTLVGRKTKEKETEKEKEKEKEAKTEIKAEL